MIGFFSLFVCYKPHDGINMHDMILYNIIKTFTLHNAMGISGWQREKSAGLKLFDYVFI